MVGEIRDKETAKIAIEAALTGHLVLSTLHTNDAPGALTRLTEMGIEPFLTASAIECIMAQKLVHQAMHQLQRSLTSQRMRHCARTGFLRKSWVRMPPSIGQWVAPDVTTQVIKADWASMKVMLVSEAIERLTVERKSADEISRVARAKGMLSLREDGIDKVLKGITSMEETAGSLSSKAQERGKTNGFGRHTVEVLEKKSVRPALDRWVSTGNQGIRQADKTRLSSLNEQ